jgi:uncharacterized membrane protein YfcA
MVPFMVEILKFHQHRAHGTSLVAVVFTGMAGAATYAIHGSVDLTAAAILALTAVATAHFGARLAGSLPEWKLKRSFGIFLILAAILLFAKPYLPMLRLDIPGIWAKPVLLLLSGMLAGLLSGMMGGGGGIVMVPVLVLVLGFDQHLAQGTSLLVMVPAGSVGAWTHKKLGNVESRLLVWIVPGLFLGAYLGASVAHLLNEGVLRTIFALVLTWLGVRYMLAPSPLKSAPQGS